MTRKRKYFFGGNSVVYVVTSDKFWKAESSRCAIFVIFEKKNSNRPS
ncbi:hypothetical protein ADIS_1458 [Lunatimonas lonarensis]|uniref:Uncharacterized protein n=1 Tax=Lunatimonas lonarensis TaxID=1232681 RepID=R7ZV99_9BACT|nr:hypothetical protein ADIS_1458 [Lunatimonas lonarensis]